MLAASDSSSLSEATWEERGGETNEVELESVEVNVGIDWSGAVDWSVANLPSTGRLSDESVMRAGLDVDGKEQKH